VNLRLVPAERHDVATRLCQPPHAESQKTDQQQQRKEPGQDDIQPDGAGFKFPRDLDVVVFEFLNQVAFVNPGKSCGGDEARRLTLLLRLQLSGERAVFHLDLGEMAGTDLIEKLAVGDILRNRSGTG